MLGLNRLTKTTCNKKWSQAFKMQELLAQRTHWNPFFYLALIITVVRVFWLFPVDDRYDSTDHRHRHRSHAGSMINDDFDPGCTRTLFVGNIEKATTFSDLKDAFERYGEIVVSFHKVVSTQNSFLLWLFFVQS